ncbi:MAG TPA: hypothetical protein VER55_05385 [Ardenticatenaceae bacterium]|nr:hypothetical protein [Ardenticatenaceae bacterium]
MFQAGRVLGFILIGVGVLLGLLGIGWGAANMAEGQLELTGFLLLQVPLLFIEALLIGAGIVILVRSRSEAVQWAEVAKERQLLNMVQARGQVRIADVALETNSTRDQVQQFVYDLVGKGLFTGYVNWDDGTLYSREARQLREGGACPNCGGKLELAGKGVVKCPFCGSEIFL